MCTALATGGAGFIRTNFVRYWLRHHPDDRVVNYDLQDPVRGPMKWTSMMASSDRDPALPGVWVEFVVLAQLSFGF